MHIPDRFLIDDGLHRPRIRKDVTDGAARFHAHCSCGRMESVTARSGQDALRAHVAHAATRIGPSKGPAWLPLGARIALLFAAMGTIVGGLYGVGLLLSQGLPGPGAKAVIIALQLTGFLLAFSLMVAVRRYIAPTRA